MKVNKVWFENDRIYAITDDGHTVWQSLLYYPRLRSATAEQREQYEIKAFGVRWDALDEDISFDSFGYDDPEPQGLSRVLLSHPELNISALARRLGIQQSLMAAYANGTKKPSKERAELICQEIRSIGEELLSTTA